MGEWYLLSACVYGAVLVKEDKVVAAIMEIKFSVMAILFINARKP